MEAAGVPDWSSLPHDLLEKIAVLVLSESGDDFLAFRRVCTLWRAAATKEIFVANFTQPWPSLPYLMLAEKPGSHEREFYNLRTKKICGKLSLPEASGKRCIEVRFGWLLTLALSGEVELLNPISRSRIQLPNFKTFPEYEDASGIKCPEYGFIQRAVLSANPSVTPDFILMVSTYEYLGFWKNEDERWNRIESYIYPSNIIYHNQDNIFYAVGTRECIYAWDSLSPGELKKISIIGENWWIRTSLLNGSVEPYLVESNINGELLLICRNGTFTGRNMYGATRFIVFRIDVKSGKCELTKSLEDDAIFIGHNVAFSIPASKFPEIVKPNRIYFTDDCIYSYLPDREDDQDGGDSCEESDDDDDRGEARKGEYLTWMQGYGNADRSKGGGKDMGVYNLEDGSIERFDESVETLSCVCPPLWIVLPSLFPLQ